MHVAMLTSEACCLALDMLLTSAVQRHAPSKRQRRVPTVSQVLPRLSGRAIRSSTPLLWAAACRTGESSVLEHQGQERGQGGMLRGASPKPNTARRQLRALPGHRSGDASGGAQHARRAFAGLLWSDYIGLCTANGLVSGSACWPLDDCRCVSDPSPENAACRPAPCHPLQH